MKKIFFLLLLFSSILAKAQYTYQIVARNLTAADNTTSANIIGSGAAFHNLTWNVSGTVSTCSVRIDGSTDGVTWGTGDVIGATTCTSNGTTISSSVIKNYVRINLVTLTGAGATFTANLSGYITQPSGGGTVTSVTCGTNLTGGTITTTGTCAVDTTTIVRLISSGTSALGTGAISSGACATVVTTSATGTLTTDVIAVGFNGDPTGVTGYVPLSTGMLTIIVYPTANNVNTKVCNNTASSITPGAITLNWRVVR